MATLSNNKGRPYLQWPDPRSGKLQTLRLGKMSRRMAEDIRGQVDRLLVAAVSGQPMELTTAKWLTDIGADLHAKLVELELVATRNAPAQVTRLGAFIDGYIKGRTDLKERTVANLNQCRRVMAEYFDAGRDVRTINPAEAKDWRRWLVGRFAKATVAMHVKKAKQFFADAAERGLVTVNPFGKLKAGSMANEDRMVYVPTSAAVAMMSHAPDAEWRAIIALARFGGLRTPSETHSLRWSDIQWGGIGDDGEPVTGRMVVRSPKTAHHEKKAVRTVPLFPDLEPYLREAFEAAEPGAVRVIENHRGDNLRTMAAKLVARAGLTAWPKLFQNLRSSRQTDLAAFLPLHVVCAWMGNTQMIAKKHYLQVIESDFDKAGREDRQESSGTPKHPTTESAAPGAAPNAGQERTTVRNNEKSPEMPGLSRNVYPQGESNKPHKGREILEISEKALRQALRDLNAAMPYIRAGDIAHLKSMVLAAKGGAA